MSPKKPAAWERKEAKRKAIDARLQRARAAVNPDNADSVIELFEASLAHRQRLYGGDTRKRVAEAWTDIHWSMTHSAFGGREAPRDRGTAHVWIRRLLDRRAAERLADTLQ